MSSVAYANKILDEAERKLLKNYSKAEFIELINKSWNIVSNSSQYQLAKLGERVSDFKKAGGVATAVIGVVSGVGNVVISNANDEDKIETLIGAGVDLILLGVGFIPGVGPVVNLAMIGATALGIDPATKIKQWYRNEQIDSLDWVTITKNGFLQVTMPDGVVYARPFMPNAQGSLFGNGKDDVLIGGDKKDIFIGHGGNDIFVGNGGKDDYFVSYGDTIIDSDGKGRVFLSSTNIQLTGGTQIEKSSQIYKGKDGTKYELKGSDLIINDSITIENFSKISNDLGIVLVDVDDIVVTMGNNQSTEGGNGKHSMEFKITLNRALKKDEFLELIINGQRVKFKEGDIEQTYIHTWDGNTIKEEDRKFEVSASVVTDKSIVKAKLAQAGNETIIDDDREFTNLNLLVA